VSGDLKRDIGAQGVNGREVRGSHVPIIVNTI
jgi:hypothetical protein